MSLFKRLSATMFSRVDRMVSEIENHDAVIGAAISDNQQALARARVRFNRLRADGRRLEQQLDELRKADQQWTRRAKEQADHDEQTALQCVQKRRECRDRIKETESALAEHRQAESRVGRELESMESRIKEMQRQRNLLRTRQSTADAMRTFKAVEDCSCLDVDDTFEKWEVRVTEAELDSGDLDIMDSLEHRFIDAEQRDALRAELEQLTREDEQ